MLNCLEEKYVQLYTNNGHITGAINYDCLEIDGFEEIITSPEYDHCVGQIVDGEYYIVFTNGEIKLIFQCNNGTYPDLDWGLVGIANMHGTMLEGDRPCGVQI